MGGAIRVVTIKDNVTSKRTRWTNNMPYFVTHHKFVNRDEKWWDDYIVQESAYSDPTTDDFSPEGYGLVVLDFDHKKIFECQGYSGLRTIDLTGVALYMNGNYVTSLGNEVEDKDDFLPDVTKKMIELGMLRMISWPENVPFDLPGTFEEVMKEFEKRFSGVGSTFTNSEFYIDWEKFGWEYHRFDETFEGYKSFYKAMIENYTLTLTESEIEHWKEWITSYEEFFEED